MIQYAERPEMWWLWFRRSLANAGIKTLRNMEWTDALAAVAAMRHKPVTVAFRIAQQRNPSLSFDEFRALQDAAAERFKRRRDAAQPQS